MIRTQIELYSTFEPARLTAFLRASNFYDLERVSISKGSRNVFLNVLGV